MYTAYIRRYLSEGDSKVHLSAVCCCCVGSTVLLQARWLLFAPRATRVDHKNCTLTQIRSGGTDRPTEGRTTAPCCFVSCRDVTWTHLPARSCKSFPRQHHYEHQLLLCQQLRLAPLFTNIKKDAPPPPEQKKKIHRARSTWRRKVTRWCLLRSLSPKKTHSLLSRFSTRTLPRTAPSLTVPLTHANTRTHFSLTHSHTRVHTRTPRRHCFYFRYSPWLPSQSPGIDTLYRRLQWINVISVHI